MENVWSHISLCAGYITGSIYYDPALLKSDFPGEKIDDGRVIAVKIHARK